MTSDVSSLPKGCFTPRKKRVFQIQIMTTSLISGLETRNAGANSPEFVGRPPPLVKENDKHDQRFHRGSDDGVFTKGECVQHGRSHSAGWSRVLTNGGTASYSSRCYRMTDGSVFPMKSGNTTQTRDLRMVTERARSSNIGIPQELVCIHRFSSQPKGTKISMILSCVIACVNIRTWRLTSLSIQNYWTKHCK